jgi:hypothetical protein
MDPLSTYEQVRADNIKRNETFLSEIGIDSVKFKQGSEAKVKRSRGTKVIIPVDPLTVRRSSRVAALPIEHTQLSYADVSDNEDVKKGIRYGYKQKRKRTEDSTDINGVDANNEELKVKYETKTVLADNASCREINSNYEIFIGTDSGGDLATEDSTKNNNNLGELLENVGFGKAAIMAASNHNLCPKFSKYSGVVEWKNCVYLWVNLGQSKPGEYINKFTEKGKYMTWYGGSRMHAESPITHRILPPGQVVSSMLDPAPLIKKSKNNLILLFVRLEGEPYCCLGPVKAEKYDIDTHPVAFTWELLLWDKLQNRSNFKRILKRA